ncbi:MAG: extracellular solute-binding protein [Clostridiales bacterium]|nr:extracellular solute-binding protein [Clostridiales bacterium]
MKHLKSIALVTALCVLCTLLPATVLAAENVELIFWTPLTSNADKAVQETLIDTFQKENPDISITVEYVSHSDWYTRWMTAIMNDDCPDMCQLDQSEVSWLVAQDIIAPMDDLFAKMDPDGTDFANATAAVNSARGGDGNLYGIPFSVNINCLWTRQDLLEEAGIDPYSIKTWDDLDSAMAAIEGDGITAMGMALAREQCAQQQLFIWSYANGAYYFDPQTGAYLLNQEDTKVKIIEAMEYIKKLFDNGQLPSGVSNWKWADYRTAMANGELGFTSSWGGDIGIAAEVNPDMLSNLCVIAHPTGPSTTDTAIHDFGGWYWSVTKTEDAAKQAAVEKWIEFVYQPDNVALETTARPVYNIPVMQSVLESPIFKNDPVTAMFLDDISYIMENILPHCTRVGFEAGPSVLAGQISATLFASDAFQAYLFNGMPIEEAYNMLDKGFQDLMVEYSYPIEGPYAK